MCSSYHRKKRPISDVTKIPDLGPTYTHLPVIERIDMLERVNGSRLIHNSVRNRRLAGGTPTMTPGSWYDARLFLNWSMGGD